jgi:anti-sigma B factor antagonist
MGRPLDGNPPDLTVRSERVDGGWVVRLAGELDLSSYAELDAEFRRVQVTGVPRIVIDLSGLGFLDSTGIRLLLEAHRRAGANGHRIRVTGAAGQVEQMLELTGVGERLRVAD